MGLAVAAGCAATAFIFAVQHDAAAAKQAGQWLEVTMQKAEHRLALHGQLLPLRSVDIAAVSDGMVASLDVAWGERVRAGQRLGSLESTELSMQVREAEASALRARLDVEGQRTPALNNEFRAAVRRENEAARAAQTAESRAADTQLLFEKGIVARLELEQAREAADSARTQANEAREDLAALRRKWGQDQLRALDLEISVRDARLRDLRDRQRRLVLTAPIDGVVLYPSQQEGREGTGPRGDLKPGARVSLGQPIMTIGTTDAYMVRLQASELDVGWLRPGLAATVRIAALPDLEIPGEVIRVAAQARSPNGGGPADLPAPGEFEVQIQVPAPGQKLPAAAAAGLRIGIGADVSVAAANASGQIVLPTAAVRWGDSAEPQVRVRAEGKEETRRIAIGRTSIDGFVVRSGVEPGDAVWVPAAIGDASSGGMRGWLDGLLNPTPSP